MTSLRPKSLQKGDLGQLLMDGFPRTRERYRLLTRESYFLRAIRCSDSIVTSELRYLLSRYLKGAAGLPDRKLLRAVADFMRVHVVNR